MWTLEHDGRSERARVQRAKVAVNGGVFFGEERPGFVRLNFGCPRATLAEGLDRIAESISTL